MPNIKSDYVAPKWLFNGHVETIVPYYLRTVTGVKYERERIQTPDKDFLDLDWSRKGNSRLAIISHGMVGNSYQSYVVGMAKKMNEVGLDALAWNFRSCSETPNLTHKLYHAGSTDDLQTVIDHAITKYGYKEIVLIGISLGGNISLKYVENKGDDLPKEIKKVVAFSVPCDLRTAALIKNKGMHGVYMRSFISNFKQKIKDKEKKFPHLFTDLNWKEINTIKDYDDMVTAPLHGFENAISYYEDCSVDKSLHLIKIPTLLVNAKNDPFLFNTCFPFELCGKSDYVFFETPDQGGHSGFMGDSINGHYWSDDRAARFIINGT